MDAFLQASSYTFDYLRLRGRWIQTCQKTDRLDKHQRLALTSWNINRISVNLVAYYPPLNKSLLQNHHGKPKHISWRCSKNGANWKPATSASSARVRESLEQTRHNKQQISQHQQQASSSRDYPRQQTPENLDCVANRSILRELILEYPESLRVALVLWTKHIFRCGQRRALTIRFLKWW